MSERYKLLGVEVDPGTEPFDDRVTLMLQHGDDPPQEWHFHGQTEFSFSLHTTAYMSLSFSVRPEPPGTDPARAVVAS